MRITHVISNLEIGGAEVALCTLIEAQATMGIAQVVVSMLPGGRLVSRLKAVGAEVIECGLTRSFRAGRGLAVIGRVIRESQPDVVQGWMYHGNVAASMARMLGYFRGPLIWGIRQSTTRLADDVPLTRLLTVTGALFSASAARIVYNSQFAAKTHERWKYPKAKRVIIPNGVDCDRFRPNVDARGRLISELGVPSDSVLIGRVARYAPMKDHKTLFAAFAQIRTAKPRSRLLLVGQGMSAKNTELTALWKENGAPEGVHFLGVRPDIETIYPALDVLISTSRSNESFSNVIFEAIASGCPVVSTDVGNSKDIRELQAVVVAPGDITALTHATLSVLDMSREARERFVVTARLLLKKRFGLQSYAEAYHGLWKSVLVEGGVKGD